MHARRGRGAFARSTAGAVATAARLAAASVSAFRGVDLVHLHSNGFIIDVAGWMAARLGRPTVLTLYGTDIWHFDPRRNRRFADVVRGAAARVFYSRALRDRAVEIGLADPRAPGHLCAGRTRGSQPSRARSAPRCAARWA